MYKKFMFLSLLALGCYCCGSQCNLPSLINPEFLRKSPTVQKRKHSLKDDIITADFGFYAVETEERYHNYNVQNRSYLSDVLLASMSDDCPTPSPKKPDSDEQRTSKALRRD